MDTFCNVASGTSFTAIRRAVQNDMGNGKWTWKMTRPAAEKFTVPNINYCQNYIDYIYSVNPHQLKFFDESGIKSPDVGNPRYGHSLVGTPAVKIMRHMTSPTITLNLMCGLDGLIYAITVNGAGNAFTF